MKDLVRRLAIVLFLGCFFVPAFSQSQDLSPELKQKTFEEVWQTVNKEFFDPNFNGVDWKAVRERYAPRVAATKTEAKFYDVLNQMLAELKVSHMRVLTPNELGKSKQVAATTGLGLRDVGGQLVIARILHGSSAEKAGLKTGYVVTAIDGKPVKTLAEAKQPLGGAAGTTLKVAYLDERNQPREVTLERVGLTASDKGSVGAGLNSYFLFEAVRLRSNIGYIRFTSFLDTATPKILAAIDSMKDAPGIIIDLRGNSGGNDEVALKMAGMLFDKETLLMINKTRNGDLLDYKAKPARNPYLGPVVILVDELSGSASEEFSAGMQESGRAYVIGTTTQGDDMDADLAKLRTGAYLLYAAGQPRTPKGVVIEGRGVIPNMEVKLSRQELLAGKDAQIEAAIQYIENRLKPGP